MNEPQPDLILKNNKHDLISILNIIFENQTLIDEYRTRVFL
jgi:hypothetical protein